MKRIHSLLLCLIAVFSLYAEDPRIDAELSSTEAFLGDAVTWTVRIRFEDGWKFAEEKLPTELGEARILSQAWIHPMASANPQPDSSSPAVPAADPATAPQDMAVAPANLELQVSLAWYKLGEAVLAPVTLTALDPHGETREFQTPEMKLTIKGVLKEGEETPARDKDQLSLTVPPLWLLITLAVILILLLIGALIYWKTRPKKVKVEPPPPPVPPYEEAIASLQALTAGPLLKEGKSKLFYGELHLVVRRYYGRLLGAHGEEMTSFEIEEMLESHKCGDYGFRNDNQEFQALCDRVKFAKYEPFESDTKKAISQAFLLIEALRHMSSVGPREVRRVPFS